MSDIKTIRALLPMLARTAAAACQKFADPEQQAIRVYLNVTAASGTGGLTVQVRGYDPISMRLGNTPVAANLNTGGAAITATGLYLFDLGLSVGAVSAGIHDSAARFLPYNWDVNVAVGDASSYTYSLSCEVFPG